jgi:phage antirepressor YoqD-like protein
MDKEWLYQQYVVQERSVTEIAEDLKIPREKIVVWLDEHKIYRNWKRANIKPIRKSA